MQPINDLKPVYYEQHIAHIIVVKDKNESKITPKWPSKDIDSVIYITFYIFNMNPIFVRRVGTVLHSSVMGVGYTMVGYTMYGGTVGYRMRNDPELCTIPLRYCVVAGALAGAITPIKICHEYLAGKCRRELNEEIAELKAL